MKRNGYDMERNLSKIKLLLTDCDGVLTDSGVYYSQAGEEMKRFSIRDGMGVERLRNLCAVETGIVTGEFSPSVVKRAEKLKITELHLGAKDKVKVLHQILTDLQLSAEEVAFIGDDVNDEGILALVGFSACPCDAVNTVKAMVHFVCQSAGGHGCFREVAELLIDYKTAAAMQQQDQH